jgi:hypothetical protein
MKFETARVCVQQRVPMNAIPQFPDEPPTYEYEVVAWPPGEVNGGLLPQIGDVLTLPGYQTPFRVIDRALHWPAPTSAEAQRGELRCDLIVEQEQAAWAASRPGRPGEAELRTEGRWLEGRVVRFETRDSRKIDAQGRPAHRFMSIAFDVPGVGRLNHFVARAWQVREMFGPETMRNLPDQEYADFGTLAMLLHERTRFEVNVAPDAAGRLSIREVRPSRPLESGEEPNTWDQSAQEVTDEAWGQI